MKYAPGPDYILYLALVNSEAKSAATQAGRYGRNTLEGRRYAGYCSYLYRAKAEAAARLAYMGKLRLRLIDTARPIPAALLIGYSPALGYHAFHLPLNRYTWPASIQSTNISSAPNGRERIEAAKRAGVPPLSEMLAELADLPPLPPRVARSWGVEPDRRSWREIEADRANAPGGVPRHRYKTRKRRKPYDRNK